MREIDQQRGLLGCDEFRDANFDQKPQTDISETSSNSDKISEPKSDQSENHSTASAMAVSNEIASDSLITDITLVHEERLAEQFNLEETLEEELTSSLQQEESLAYVMSKANKLENAIRVVNQECDNLIAVCDPEDEEAIIRQNEKILFGSFGNSAGLSSKRMLAVASVALLATCGGVYAYVSPQNPIKLALHSKIVEITNQPVTVTVLQPSNNVYASLNGISPPSQYFSAQDEKPTKPSPEPKHSEVVSIGQLDSKPNVSDAPIVREIIPQAPRPDNLQVEATEAVGLSERFGKPVILEEKQPIISSLQGFNASEAENPIMDTQPKMTVSRKDELKLQPDPPIEISKKRNIEMVKRVVFQANAGATLDNSQVEVLVAKLADGDCLSSALQGIFGEDKISPVFVRELLADMENRC